MLRELAAQVRGRGGGGGRAGAGAGRAAVVGVAWRFPSGFSLLQSQEHSRAGSAAQRCNAGGNGVHATCFCLHDGILPCRQPTASAATAAHAPPCPLCHPCLCPQVEPPAALTCLCSLPLLGSLTAEVLYVDPWRQLAELAEQLAGDEEEAEEEEESEGEEEEEQSEEGSESGSESEEESDGGEVVEESEELGSSEEGLVAPAAAARAREGSAARLPPAARAREMEFCFSRGPQLELSGVSAGAGGGVNGADFAAAVAATQAAATPSPADAAAAAAAGSAASPSVATGSAGPAPAVAPASAAIAAIAAAAAAAELAALAVALGPGRAEHIRAVLERGSGALQEMAPMDLFSCFAGGSSNGSSNGSSSAAAGAAGGSGSSRVGLTELDVTFVGCGLLPGCWAGVEALGGSLRRLALRVGRSAEEERLVARWVPRNVLAHAWRGISKVVLEGRVWDFRVSQWGNQAIPGYHACRT